ncbi:MAG: restriction endonuclease subunit S [Bacteroidaceae bacterium]|nr:restriction endonuclease subunit S [Bacteroidaceae bacterium]
MEEWKEYKLGDLIVLSSGGTPNKSNSSYWGGDIPWISAKAMYDDYLYSSDMTITREGLNNGSKLAPVNSILLLTRGSGLFNRIPVCLVKREMAFNQDVKCIESINQNIVSTLFLFYWLMGNKQEISNMLETTGIGAGKIDTERLKSIHIKLPPIQIQQVLIKFAESLMLKIEVNRRINDNLEQQAQALFKSWFVDFEPFKDGEFVESELGMIPKGWRVISLNEACAKVTDGSHYSPKDNQKGAIPMLSVKDMGHYGFNYSSCKRIDVNEYERMMINDCVPKLNDILVAKDGSYLKEIFICSEEVKQAILSSIAIFRSNSNVIYPEILLQLLRLPSVRKDVGDNYVSGSALPRIVLKDFKKFKFIVAPIIVQNKIIGSFKALLNQINVFEQESRRLSSLRDTLLPRLMSGELKINDISV